MAVLMDFDEFNQHALIGYGSSLFLDLFFCFNFGFWFRKTVLNHGRATVVAEVFSVWEWEIRLI